jgi:hypothetical protein
MMIRRYGASAALLAALFLAGCAGDGAPTSGPGGTAASGAPTGPVLEATSAPPPTTIAAAPGPTPRAGTSSDTGKAKPPGDETLTGQVIAGVEPGCLILTGPAGARMLIVKGDAAKAVKVGATITVVGRADPGMVTTCQQGTPFVVSSATVR